MPLRTSATLTAAIGNCSRADGVVPFRMERVTLNVERLHLGIADLDALFVSAVSSALSIFRPALVVVAAISSTTAMRSVSGRPRQVCVMWQNRRCSIRFHFDVPGADNGGG